MGTGKQFSITLEDEAADAIDKRVSSGAYTDASAVVRASLDVLEAHEQRLEDWLTGEVLAGHSEYVANPSSALDGDALRRQLGLSGE